ncbi:uncharacterized protein LOC117824100 [Xyrichtys novacula]|nr:uncharacterized protein LOC117824100 [Xyrichtys novacula]
MSQSTNLPAPSGYISSSPGGFQHAASEDVAWAVQPLSLLTGVAPAGSNAAGLAAEPVGASYGAQPQYHPGDLAQYEGSYEHGNSESETHGLDYQSKSRGAPAPAVEQVYVSPLPVGPGGFGGMGFGGWPAFSYLYDYMFMTGQYPPGTLTHSSESYEQGADHWQDAHYQRYYIPSYTLTEIQPVVQEPKGKTPNAPVKQTTGMGGF